MTHINQQGFTLIELVMVMVILGILSISAIGLFATRDDFASALVENQALSSLRLAQQAALARQTGNVSLAIGNMGSQWRFQVLDGTTVLAEALIDQDGTGIRVGSCGAAAPTFPVTIAFTRTGDLAGAANLQLCVTGEIDNALCVSASGYAFEGACR